MSGRNRRPATSGSVGRGKYTSPLVALTVAVEAAAGAAEAAGVSASAAQSDADDAQTDATTALANAATAIADAADAQTAADAAQASADAALEDVVLHGTGAPGGGLGTDGRMYVDETTGAPYGKGSGNWLPA